MGNVDNVIRPLLLSGKSRMNTLVMLLSLLGGVSAFGFIGIVLGPLVAAMVTALAESYVTEIPPAAPSPGPGAGPGEPAAAGPVIVAVAAPVSVGAETVPPSPSAPQEHGSVGVKDGPKVP
jgi:hypothetical protein